MPRRHLALPRVWLLTDERQGDRVWEAIDRLPRGAGVVVRHYSMAKDERGLLLKRIGKRRDLFIAWSGREQDAIRLGADAFYGPGRPTLLPRLAPVHDRREILKAEMTGAALLLLSPVFATRSHARSRPLGPLRFGQLARAARMPVIALGGMTSRRMKRLRGLNAQGWAAIDAWTPIRT